MAGIQLTDCEQFKARILTEAIAGKITNAVAGKKLGLSIRQVQRAKAAVRRDGIKAVVHKLKGKVSNHAIDAEKKKQALNTIKEKYTDFKPTLATETLEENHGITISRETTRLWMMEEGLWKKKRQKKTG